RSKRDWSSDVCSSDLGSELGIVSILETGNVNVYQILDKDYVHSSADELRKRINEYVKAAVDYGVDPSKITGIVDQGERPAERIRSEERRVGKEGKAKG